METVIKIHTWQKWIEPWYISYGLLGATVAGFAPILLPLAASRTGSVVDVGLVMAAFNLGGLAGPLWGELADRYRLHRYLLAGGLLVTAAGLAAFPFTLAFGVWVVLALLQGAGAAAATTVANLFIVERHSRSEWDERIGWLQTFYGGGQVGGLLLVGVLSQANLSLAFLAAAGLTLIGVVPGWLTTHTPALTRKPQPVLKQPAHHGEWAVTSPQRSYHRLNLGGIRQLGTALRSPFGIFLATWLLSFAGASAVFSLYPVLMQKTFGIAPAISSPGFALAAALGLSLYSPAGQWSSRWGATRVLRIGLVVRLIAFLSLFGLGVTTILLRGELALLSFVFVVLAWSLLSVAGTALAAQLTPIGEGEALGIFNAATAVAGMIGAAMGGWIASVWGYDAAAGLAAVGVVMGLLLASLLDRSRS